MMLEKEGFNTSAVMGNHDKLLLDLYDDRIGIRNFKEKGGDQTLKSFGVGLCRDIPQKYFKFIERLSPFIITGDYVIVHAGINFGADDPWKDFQSMMTIRDYHVGEDQSKFKKIIHGHQASPLKDILNMVLDESATTLNLDNGCVYTEREGMGNLFVLNLEDMSFHILPCLD
jgi:serine/threonine protein phosphatase 1